MYDLESSGWLSLSVCFLNPGENGKRQIVHATNHALGIRIDREVLNFLEPSCMSQVGIFHVLIIFDTSFIELEQLIKIKTLCFFVK